MTMLDIKKIRRDFLFFKEEKPLIYLDNAATSLKPKCVADVVYHYLTKESTNVARGDYSLASTVTTKYEQARAKIANFINAKPKEIIFTSGASSSINTVALGFALPLLKAGDEILLSEAEHASNVLPWFNVARKIKAVVKYIPLSPDGHLSIESFKSVFTAKTKIVALAHVSNVLGYTVDIASIAKIVHQQKGSYLVIDGAQSVPHIKTDVKALDCDFLSFSSHKMCGPTGVGVLYGKQEVLELMEPLFEGGSMNSRFDTCGNVSYAEIPQRFETGTPAIEGAIGLGRAVDYLTEIGMDNISAHVNALHKYAVDELSKIPKIIIYNKNSDTGIITFNYEGVFAQDLATHFNKYNIAVRSGQHCAKILMTFLKTPATVRASLYFYNTKEEIDEFVKAAAKAEEYLDAFF
jgi:cysteine desulfurase/selenocysteine lyase